MTNEKRFLLSAAGGSGIAVFDLLTCPRKIKLLWDGWRLKKTPFYFPNGSIIHKTAFLPYTDDEKPSALPEIARNTISNVIETGKYTSINQKTGELQTEEVYFKDDDIMDGADIAEKQMEVWSEKLYHPAIVESCEYKIVADILNPKKELRYLDGHLEQVGIAGRLDMVINEGSRKIVDFKTCKSPLKFDTIDELNYIVQLGTYRYLLTMEHQKLIQNVAFFQMVKNKTKSSIEKHAHEIPIIGQAKLRFDYIYEIYKKAAEILLACVNSGKWEKSFNCRGLFGQICKYYPLCFPKQYDKPNDEIHRTLYRKPGYKLN